ncbi:MarR family transcriptional regulator [Spongiibacter taiwanensis]|uniref:MarR family winged helix-turn-helix transcriptional regulator n=1 Tax=Spongiibacter taiwanensis TaxID=1748242 RepID=UPI0020352D9C|nr:MarR family transcriptional regulator [Spongiibacter taiwanensis]USA42225.1 MarR family transcriptional regulator [Spongiibacter taiwanensis]
MRGIERLRSIERSTEPLANALPELSKDATILVRLLRVAGFGLSDYFSDVFRGMGISETMYHLLAVLYASEGGRNSPTQLSELIGTGRANMTKVIGNLEKLQLVHRETDTGDARRSVVTITEKGKALMNEITPKVSNPITNAFNGLSKAEQKQLSDLLRKTIVSFDRAKTY